MKIVGLDVGKTNFGYAIMKDYNIIKSGELENTLIDFKNPMLLKINIDLFLSEIKSITKDANIIIAERFITARALKGNPSEFCNFMLGLSFANINVIPILITAAEWKKQFKYILDIKNYKSLQHRFDASLMCFYCLKKLKLLNDFQIKKRCKGFIYEFERMSKKQ